MQQQELVCPLIIILQSNDPVLCTFMCPAKWSINYCTLQQQAGEVCSRRAITATHGMYTVGPKPIPLHWLQSNCQSIQSVRGLGWWMVMYNTLLLAARGHEAKQRPVSQSLHPTPAIAHSLTHTTASQGTTSTTAAPLCTDSWAHCWEIIPHQTYITATKTYMT